MFKDAELKKIGLGVLIITGVVLVLIWALDENRSQNPLEVIGLAIACLPLTVQKIKLELKESKIHKKIRNS